MVFADLHFYKFATRKKLLEFCHRIELVVLDCYICAAQRKRLEQYLGAVYNRGGRFEHCSMVSRNKGLAFRTVNYQTCNLAYRRLYFRISRECCAAHTDYSGVFTISMISSGDVSPSRFSKGFYGFTVPVFKIVFDFGAGYHTPRCSDAVIHSGNFSRHARMHRTAQPGTRFADKLTAIHDVAGTDGRDTRHTDVLARWYTHSLRGRGSCAVSVRPPGVFMILDMHTANKGMCH